MLFCLMVLLRYKDALNVTREMGKVGGAHGAVDGTHPSEQPGKTFPRRQRKPK